MSQQTQTLSRQLQQYEKQIIADTLTHHPKLYQVAEALGIKYCTLWRKMKRYGICS